MLRRVMFEYLAYNDDPDTTFLSDLCQEILRLMTPPPSYHRRLILFIILYHQALLVGQPVDAPEWRAAFRCDQIEKAYMDHSPSTVS
jgi:hypothetical protein